MVAGSWAVVCASALLWGVALYFLARLASMLGGIAGRVMSVARLVVVLASVVWLVRCAVSL